MSRRLESFESVWQSPTAVRARPDTTFAQRTHRETPPPGQKAYGIQRAARPRRSLLPS